MSVEAKALREAPSTPTSDLQLTFTPADATGFPSSITHQSLGIRLKEEVKSVVHWIAEQPELPRVRSKGYRRVNLKVFPYYIAYILHADAIWVLAIAHSARFPEYWITRSIPE